MKTQEFWEWLQHLRATNALRWQIPATHHNRTLRLHTILDALDQCIHHPNPDWITTLTMQNLTRDEQELIHHNIMLWIRRYQETNNETTSDTRRNL